MSLLDERAQLFYSVVIYPKGLGENTYICASACARVKHLDFFRCLGCSRQCGQHGPTDATSLCRGRSRPMVIMLRLAPHSGRRLVASEISSPPGCALGFGRGQCFSSQSPEVVFWNLGAQAGSGTEVPSFAQLGFRRRPCTIGNHQGSHQEVCDQFYRSQGFGDTRALCEAMLQLCLFASI